LFQAPKFNAYDSNKAALKALRRSLEIEDDLNQKLQRVHSVANTLEDVHVSVAAVTMDKKIVQEYCRVKLVQTTTLWGRPFDVRNPNVVSASEIAIYMY